MARLNEKEIAVTQIALDTLVTALDGLPLKDEDALFGEVVEALEEQVLMEGDVIKTVLAIKEKVDGGIEI